MTSHSREPGLARASDAGGAASVIFFACDDPKIAQWTAFLVHTMGVVQLYERCRAQASCIPHGVLRETPWGTREFVVLDQDTLG